MKNVKSTETKMEKNVIVCAAAVLAFMALAASSAYAGGKVVVNGQLNVSGNTYQGGNALYVDQSSGYVGIGTTAPGYPLDVLSHTSPQFRVGYDGTAYLTIEDGSSNAYIKTNTGDIRINPSSNVILAQSNGYVGIGTTSPSEKLELGGGYSPTLRFDFYSPDYSTSWYGNVGDYGSTFGQDSLGGVQFLSQRDTAAAGTTFYDFVTKTGSNSPVSAMVINNAGNVGIDTVVPFFPLQVQSTGSVNIAAFTTSDFSESGYPGVGSMLLVSTGAATGNTYSALSALHSGWDAVDNLILQPNGGNVGIGTTAPSERLNVNGSLRVDNATGSAVLYVNPSSGNVGIGTDWPYQNLIVVAHSATPTIAVDRYGYGNGGLAIDTSGNLDVAVGNFGSNQLIFKTGVTWNGDFAATGTERMRIDGSTGNVGIGTAAPSTKLDINQSTDDNTGGIRIQNSVNAAAGRIWVSGANNLRIDNGATAAGNISLNGAGTGNVGIGTTAPGAKLDIYNIDHITTDNYEKILSRITEADDEGGLWAGQAAGMAFHVKASDSDIDAGAIYGKQMTGTPTKGGLTFHTNNGSGLAEVMRIDYAGNVGIGTTSPNMALAVKGNANITGNLWVSGQQMGVPDYVFDGNYSLMPLSDLDVYIKEYHHLPNMAGRNDTDQVDVVGQQQKLQEKIEELTLYVLQLKEENGLLKSAFCADHPGAEVCA